MCVIAVFAERCHSAHHDDAKRNQSQRSKLATLIPCGRVHVFSQVDFKLKNSWSSPPRSIFIVTDFADAPGHDRSGSFAVGASQFKE
jgi:hypothetical protein